jgi:predicted amidophosphoribosyltransferase
MLLDLVVPLECGGCGAPSTRWCESCASALAVKADEPHLITPRLDCDVPVFSLGRYAGVRRAAILAVKEHGRADLVPILGAVLNAGLTQLLGWGIIDGPLTLVPAPTRRSTARRRGGDPVTRIAVATRLPGSVVAPVLRTRAFTRDSVGLSAGQRQHNISGRVLVRGRALARGPCDGRALARGPCDGRALARGPCDGRALARGPCDGRVGVGEVVLVDDVSTTGATASESVRVLQRAGARVTAVVVIANA